MDAVNKIVEENLQENFALICFIVLMQNGNGLSDKSPSYVIEKKTLLKSGFEAYAYLDRNNQIKVLEWYQKWRATMPNEIKNYEKEIFNNE